MYIISLLVLMRSILEYKILEICYIKDTYIHTNIKKTLKVPFSSSLKENGLKTTIIINSLTTHSLEIKS